MLFLFLTSGDLLWHMRSPKVTGGQKMVKFEKSTKDPIFGFYVYIISLTSIVYGILTSEVKRGHQMSLEIKIRSNLKCSPREFIFGKHSHMISLTNISYYILTSKDIRGHQRSLEVKRRSNLKNTPRDSIFGIYTHIISLNNIGYDILTSKIIRCHQRSVEVKWGQIWNIHPGSPFLTSITLWYPWPI